MKLPDLSTLFFQFMMVLGGWQLVDMCIWIIEHVTVKVTW